KFSVPASDATLQVFGMSGAATQTVNTNSAGVASVDIQTIAALPANDILQGYFQTQVTASAPNTNTVTFYVTAAAPTPSIRPLAPAPQTTLTGTEGSVLTGAVKVQVASNTGFGIPNVSLSLNDGNSDASLFPTAACNAPGGFVLTNNAGIAGCDVVFGPRVGTGTFTVNVGFINNSTLPNQFVVTPGAPATVQITQGNNQTGTAGQKLPAALV